MARRAQIIAPLLSGALALTSCATTESAEKPENTEATPAGEAPPPPSEAPPGDAPPGEAPPVDPPAGEPAAPPAEEPAAPEEDAATAPPAKKPEAGKRSPDGIDDDTPLPTDPNSPAAVAFQDAVQESRTNPRAAMDKFVEAAGRTTYFYAAWFNAGVAAERAGDAGAAERHYREALKVRPDYGPALVNLSMLLEKGGRASESDRVIDDALARHGDRSGPHVAAAMRAYRRGELKRAETEALEAIRIDERSVPAMHLMARVFFQQKRYDTAKFALKNALDLEPGNALLRLDLGHVMMKLEEEKDALVEYARAAQLRPDLAEAQESHGILLLKSGDPEAALAALEKNAQLRPGSARAQLHLGNALRANKKYKEAVAAYKKALEIDAELDEAHFNLACLYMDNPIEGVDELDQLKLAQEEFKVFEERAGKIDAKVKGRLTEYVESVDKRVKRLERRRERERRRKLIEEEEKKKAAEGNPGAGEAVPPAEGSAEGGGAAESGGEK